MTSKYGLPSRNKIIAVFGSYAEAKEAAGLPVLKKQRSFYDKIKVEKILVEKYKEYGRQLKIKEIDIEKELPTGSILVSLLGFQSIEEMWEYMESKYKLKRYVNAIQI